MTTTTLTESTTPHATPATVCAVCGGDQSSGLIYDSRTARWLCPDHDQQTAASCGCTRAHAYSHTPAHGFRCVHGSAV